jgi:hypothetical protein
MVPKGADQDIATDGSVKVRALKLEVTSSDEKT